MITSRQIIRGFIGNFLKGKGRPLSGFFFQCTITTEVIEWHTIPFNKQIEKLKSTEKVYNVYSLKWGKWWGANNSGYTSDKRLAGIYLESNILSSQSYYNDGVTNKAILAFFIVFGIPG